MIDKQCGDTFYEQSAVKEYMAGMGAKLRIELEREPPDLLRSLAKHIADDVAQDWADDRHDEERPKALLEVNLLFYFDRKPGEAADVYDRPDVEMVLQEHHSLEEWFITSLTVLLDPVGMGGLGSNP